MEANMEVQGLEHMVLLKVKKTVLVPSLDRICFTTQNKYRVLNTNLNLEFTGDDETNPRPASAASSYSSPGGLGLEDDGIRSSTRSAKSEGRQPSGFRSKKALDKRGHRTHQTFAEVGIRNIGGQISHSLYKGTCRTFIHLSDITLYLCYFIY